MSRTAAVKIGTTHLTSDGTNAGRACKVRVENESAFASSFAANSVTALDSTVHTQIVGRGVRGIEFDVVAEFLYEDVLASILAQLNAALGASSPVRVVVDSLTDFDVMAVPVFQGGQLFTFESRSGGVARNVRLRFISTAPGA